MFTIHLNNLQFFSYHGIHEEEKILGNEYEVNAEVSFEEKGPVVHIHETINYTQIYALIKQRMNIPTHLLETVAQDLAQQIRALDPVIKSITISIEKKNPPLPNIQGSVGVTYKREF